MGYAINVAMSVPLAILLYMLTDKFINNLSLDSKFNDRVQRSFITGFIIGLTFIALGMTVFANGSNIDNQTLQLAMYITGMLLILNTVLFNWDGLDEGTKIIILGVGVAGLIIYTYQNRQ